MYGWVKVLHVVSVISWMAGLLYLPRLFIYHFSHTGDDLISSTFKTMEQRLLRFIMRPAMIFTWLTGSFLVFYGGYYFEYWFLAKLTFVLLLTAVHSFLADVTRDFALDRNTRTTRFFRYLNEAPTLLMIGIVTMVVLKPF